MTQNRTMTGTGSKAQAESRKPWNGEDRCGHCGALCGHASKCYECGQSKRKESV